MHNLQLRNHDNQVLLLEKEDFSNVNDLPTYLLKKVEAVFADKLYQ